MPLSTVKTALAAHCIVDALCLDCDGVWRLDRGAGRAAPEHARPKSAVALRVRVEKLPGDRLWSDVPLMVLVVATAGPYRGLGWSARVTT